MLQRGVVAGLHGADAAVSIRARHCWRAMHYKGAADQLPRWNRAGGRMLPGLTRRRAAERAMFLGDA